MTKKYQNYSVILFLNLERIEINELDKNKKLSS